MTEDERPKFERYAELFGLPLSRADKQTDGTGRYSDPLTHAAWSAWQARAFISTDN